MKIAFIGCGKLGQPASEYFETYNYEVNRADVGDSIEDAVQDCEYVFVAVPTPHDPRYDGKYVCSDLPPKDFDYSIVKEVVQEANKHMTEYQCLVLISTVLPGTITEQIAPLVTNTNFLYNPYLIAMGTVKQDMFDAEMIMIGGDNTWAKKLSKIYKRISKTDRHILGTYEEIESLKIFYNTFITTKITLCNMIQDVSHKLGNMNVDVVTKALAESTMRIMSPKYMKAGMGDGGSCHPRDNIALKHLAEKLELGYDLFGGLIKAREEQARNMAQYLHELSEYYKLPIVIVGKGFKPGLEYEDGSPSILVGQFIENVKYDDFTTPAIFLLAHSAKTTFGINNDEYIFPEGSVIVDPWRERENAIWYGSDDKLLLRRNEL